MEYETCSTVRSREKEKQKLGRFKKIIKKRKGRGEKRYTIFRARNLLSLVYREKLQKKKSINSVSS